MTGREDTLASNSANATSTLSDPELVAGMSRGDATCLAELYARHASRLLTILRGVLSDATEAEDLLHEVFLEAWRLAEGYDGARGSVLTWLSVRARARGLDRRKSVNRRRVVPSEEAMLKAEPVATPEPVGDRRMLFGALRRLPEAQQEVLALAYFEDLSATEIATTLNVPVGTVKSRTRVALTSLRQLLQNDEGALAGDAPDAEPAAPAVNPEVTSAQGAQPGEALPQKAWSQAKL